MVTHGPLHGAEYKEAFALFDKKGTGAVPREVLGDLLRALGQNPTQAEVADIVAGAPREGAYRQRLSYLLCRLNMLPEHLFVNSNYNIAGRS